jgi:hypothetical protein
MNKIQNWVWLILTLAFGWMVFARIGPQFRDFGGDSCQYIVIGESIANGSGLRMINYPGEPFSALAPLLSLILAPVLYFSGRNFFLMQLEIIALSYFSLVIFYRLFKRDCAKIALLAAVLLALNRVFLYFSFRILTEALFLFLSALSFLMLSRYKDKPSFFCREGMFTALSLILVYLSRYIGALIFFASLIYLLFDNKDTASKRVSLRKIYFLSILVLPVVIFWGLRNSHINNSYVYSTFKQFMMVDFYRPHLGSISQHPGVLITRFINGAFFYFYIIGKAVFPFLDGVKSLLWWNVLSLACAFIVILGLAVRVREGKYAFAAYFLIYLVFLCLWPFLEDGRYILPVLPFIFFYFLVGLEKLCSFAYSKRVFFAVVTLILAFHIVSSLAVTQEQARMKLPESFVDFLSVHSWAKNNLPYDNSVILSRQPTITYFYSAHKSISYPFSLNAEDIMGTILKYKVKYIVADESFAGAAFYMDPLLSKYQEKLRMLYSKGKSAIYEVLR